MIVVLGGVKGGGGKTTLATNLVVMRSQQKKKILFIDADEIPWDMKQIVGKSIHLNLQKETKNYDDIIIDVGGRDTTSQRSALVAAHIYLVPFRPRSPDIWTMDYVDDLVNGIREINPFLKCFFVINQADSTGKDNQSSIDILNESNHFKNSEVVRGNRKCFGNAFSDGLGVIEMKKKDQKACKEIKNLYDFVYKKCSFSVR